MSKISHLWWALSCAVLVNSLKDRSFAPPNPPLPSLKRAWLRRSSNVQSAFINLKTPNLHLLHSNSTMTNLLTSTLQPLTNKIQIHVYYLQTPTLYSLNNKLKQTPNLRPLTCEHQLCVKWVFESLST